MRERRRSKKSEEVRRGRSKALGNLRKQRLTDNAVMLMSLPVQCTTVNALVHSYVAN